MTFVFFIIFILLVSVTVVLIVPVYSKYQKMEQELRKLEKELEEKNAECIRLNKQVHGLQRSPKAVEKVGREKFGLCREGETIYKYDKKEIPEKDDD